MRTMNRQARSVAVGGTMILFILALAAVPAPAAAPRQQVAQTRQITLALHEGTSMAAALSPDGKTLAIDLLWQLVDASRERRNCATNY